MRTYWARETPPSLSYPRKHVFLNGERPTIKQNGMANLVEAVTEEQQMHYLWDADRLRESCKMAEELAKDSELHCALVAPPQTPFSDPDTRLTH